MLSQAAGYAAAALGCAVSMGEEPVLVREIARACGIPGPYLAKIVHLLGRKGILRTRRGVRGGISLAHDARDVTLHDVCRALDDPILEKRCMLRTAECTDERGCPAHCFWKEHREREVEFLKRTTIADVAAFETRRRRLDERRASARRRARAARRSSR